MITFTPTSFANALLSSSSTQTSWSNTFKNMLGNNRQVVGIKDGVEFYRASLTGDMTISAGKISYFGAVNNVTKNLAADLATGTCYLRVEGNGNTWQASLGLKGSGADYTFSSNPDGVRGLGFSTSSTLGPFAFLPTGSGPVAPDVPANAVVAFRLMDYSNESAPIAVGTAQFNVRDRNLVLEKPWMASAYGDVRQMRVADGAGIVLGTGGDCFRFAGHSYLVHAGANADVNAPLQQVEIRAVPHGRWSTYPYRGNFNAAVDTLIPGAFKVELLRADGSVKDVIEMYSTRDVNNTPGSGKPVNFASQSVTDMLNKPAQAFWTCYQTLYWESNLPAIHPKASHLIPGVEDEALDPTNVSEFASCINCWPAITGKDTFNGLNFWRLAPKWSKALGADTLDTTIIDPYMPINQIRRDSCMTQVIGRGYEPGSTGGHVWYMAPGGSRHDRACWPTSIVTYMSQPNGLRPHGNVPFKEIFYDWNKNYFNHGQHYFTNLEKGIGLAKSNVLGGADCYNDTYYNGGNENFRADLPNHAVRILSAGNQSQSGAIDKNGRRFNNEWSRDNQHNQNTAAVGAYTLVSPAHVHAARHSFASNILANFDYSLATFGRSEFLTRQHNWYNWQFLNAWIVSTPDERGFSGSEIETMWQKHLESVYDAVMPSYLTGIDTYSKTLRVLGLGSTEVIDGGMTTVIMNTDSKACYWGQTLLLMKQSGAFSVMRAKSSKCSAILDLIITCLGKLTVDFFIDSNGRPDKLPTAITYPTGTIFDPVNWGVVAPPNGLLDWITDVSGSRKLSSGALDATNTMHFRAQALRILKNYFPEYTIPRMAQAEAIVTNFYAIIENGRKDGTTSKFNYRFSMMGLFKSPTVLGAPV